MNSPHARHLDDSDLLRLIDGEAPRDAATAAEAHIEACWTCCTRFHEFENAIDEYVRYQKASDPLLPPPPGAWPELKHDVPRLLTMPARRWFDVRWAIAAAAVAVIALVTWRFQRVPSVSAAELLRRAGAVESTPAPIRVKSKGRTRVRAAVLMTANAEDSSLRKKFERAHFDWEQPLSARAFTAWREQLRDKRDEVKQSQSSYEIRTSTDTSELRRATITIRARDMRPVREMLEFIDETVEIEDAPEEVLPREQIAAAPPAHSVLTPESPVHRKLEVFTVLHRLGADLGEPIEIHQKSEALEVIATGFSAARREQLRTALIQIPEVVVRFDEGGVARPALSKTAQKPMLMAASPGQIRLQTLLGSAQSAEAFTNGALDASDAALARVHALRALAKAFPPVQEAEMNAADHETLRSLRREHLAALIARVAELRNVLQAVIADLPARPPSAPAGSWQDAAEALLPAAQQLDQALNVELAGSGTPDGSGFQTISSALGRLERQVARVTP